MSVRGISQEPSLLCQYFLVTTVAESTHLTTLEADERIAGQHTSPIQSVCVCVYVTVEATQNNRPSFVPAALQGPTRRSYLTAGWDFEEFIMKRCLRLARERLPLKKQLRLWGPN